MSPAQFRKKIYTYAEAANRQLPWRETTDPYKILVSEIMLQQTQAERVIPKYQAFIKKFPTFKKLADAKLADLLSAWQGLGYNRRALSLQKTAQIVVQKYKGKLPNDPERLQELPGIGPATAASIVVYAFNLPFVFIETNVRTVFIHCFFSDRTDVSDTELLPVVTKMLDRSNPRKWYNALMDYGVMLKKTHKNPSRASAHYIKQSTFKGSLRQVRGQILKIMTDKKSIPLKGLASELAELPQATPQIVDTLVTQLEKEGFIQRKGSSIFIA
jgi:A/G-specific adenine glycosylase